MFRDRFLTSSQVSAWATDAVVTIPSRPDPAQFPQVKLLAATNTATPSTSFSVPLTASTPGKDLLALVHSGAQVTLTGGWTAIQNFYLNYTDITLWRMATPSASQTVVAGTMGASRRVSVVVLETTLMGGTGGMYMAMPQQNPSGGTSWSTGTHTLTKQVGVAVWTTVSNAATIASDVTGLDQGFALLADTGATPTGSAANEVTRIWMARKEPASLSGGAVTATLSPAVPSPVHPTAQRAGMLGWDAA